MVMGLSIGRFEKRECLRRSLTSRVEIGVFADRRSREQKIYIVIFWRFRTEYSLCLLVPFQSLECEHGITRRKLLLLDHEMTCWEQVRQARLFCNPCDDMNVLKSPIASSKAVGSQDHMHLSKRQCVHRSRIRIGACMYFCVYNHERSNAVCLGLFEIKIVPFRSTRDFGLNTQQCLSLPPPPSFAPPDFTSRWWW